MTALSGGTGAQVSDNSMQCVCVSCNVPLNPPTLRYQFPNRHDKGVCQSCRVPPSRPFECGRCCSDIPASELMFFCDMCADPVCASCLECSFESGLLKCANCCPAPVRYHVRQSGVGHLVTEQLLAEFHVPAKAASPMPTADQARSRYMTLSRKEKLGEGAQGVVYKCETSDGEVVVSKEMLFDEVDGVAFELQCRQSERMRQLNHPHLIRYLDVIPRAKPPRLCVIMPYYSEGDLRRFIERQRSPVPEVRLCSIVLQIAGALNYLHSQDPPLIHLDVKPENILLLNNEEQVLLMDLDLCSSVEVSASMIKRANEPTYEYSAPELMRSTGSPKSDVFSLGVVMFVLATFPDIPSMQNDAGESTMICDSTWTKASLERAIKRDLKKVKNYKYSDAFGGLLVRMLLPEPSERPTCAEVSKSLSVLMERRLLEGGA